MSALLRLPFVSEGVAGLAAVLLLLCGWLHTRAGHWHGKYETEVAGRAADRRAVEAATAAARAADQAHADQVRAQDAAIQQENQSALETQLAAARAAAADYAARLRSQPTAVASGGRDPHLPAAPATAIPAAPADTAPVVPVSSADLQSCAISDTVARGWQNWWERVSAAPR